MVNMADIIAVRSRRRRRRILLLGAAFWYMFLRKKTRSVWTRPWLLKRPELGAYDTLISELRCEDESSFLNFLRVSPMIFDDLLTKVSPLIERQDTVFRKAISPGMRLAITLRYLATGETYKSLGYLFRVGNNTIGTIVPETCWALYDVLREEYFQCPSTPAEWKQVASEFYHQWNFPNCLGALDGKHVSIKQPACSGSKFFNYKHTFSIILLALVDANYKFLFCDCGSQGRCSDSGVFGECELQESLANNTLGIPAEEPLPGTRQKMPFVIVADDAFPLRRNIMKPFPHRNLSRAERVFNYRLSRARRCVENAFGIMANRFRVLLHPICLQPQKVDKVIMACCALHNMLRTLAPTKYIMPADVVPNAHNGHVNTGELQPAKASGRRSVTQEAKELRQQFCTYFNSPQGSVPWQVDQL